MMTRRKNVLMDVTPTPTPPEERVPTPPPPLAKPTEKEIFKQPLPTVEESVEEEIEQIPQVAPPKKQKRPCTDKMKAHLARCRELAKEKKAKIKAAKAPAPSVPPVPQAQPEYTPAQPINIPQRPTTNWLPDTAPPQQRPTTNAEIDYERIINGVAGRFQKQQVEDDALTMLEKRIREEERAHAEKKYSEYFVDAASKFKKKMYTGYGRQTILGRNTNKPFGAPYAYDKSAANPFDKCFN
tara:strand:- start:5984 stop:6703 length:720 start_codon:yes stop_codon:yes gene_type:complete